MIDASLDMWLTTGRFNDEFEKKFAKYLGVKYALSSNSGSSANLLALSVLTSHKLGDRQLKKGDEMVSVDPRYFRPSEVDILIGDATKAREKLGWVPKRNLADLVDDMINSDLRKMKREKFLMDTGYRVKREFK